MIGFRTTEEHLSQVPALHLLQNLGYTYLTVQEADAQRSNRLSNVILEPILREQLKQINRINYKDREYLFSEENIQSAIQKLKNIRYDGLIRTNEEIYDLLTLGTSLEQTIENDTKSFSLKYINWKNWENNVFHVTAEFTVERTRSTETCRPDVVLFVNGIPFAVIECKSPQEELEQGVSQNIRNQREEFIPKLFTYTQLVMATNKNEVKYATTGTPSRFWAVWREKEDKHEDVLERVQTPLNPEQKAKLFEDFPEEARIQALIEEAGGRQLTEQDQVLYSICRPERLLDLAFRFSVFDAGIRKIARYQQFFAIQNILKRVQQFDANDRRQGGVIWHTQGSGKSLTMVMMAHALQLEPSIVNPRVVLVTDRIDLDDQIKKTFANTGLSPVQARNGRHLLKLVQENKASIITTIIDKFDTALNVEAYQETAPNIFMLVDESHRSQHGTMHAKMRKMFPNACYLGFTGTPLMKKEKSTFDQFGGIIDKYTIDQAVKDGAVVPLLYEGRHSEQHVNREAIDTWFERVCQGLSEEQKVDLKKKYSRAEMLNRTEQTIYCRAFDISEHFRQTWQGTDFKAQLVSPSKKAAIQYKHFLDEIGHVSCEVLISPPDQREGYEDPEEEEIEDSVLSFWQKMMRRFGNKEDYEKNLINRFKNGEEPEIIIVVDKLLTGFDAPRNTVLYLTRKLKDHTLLQAIARVNRLFEDKEFGYIIDYAGILGNLDQALTSYSSLEEFEEEDLCGALVSIQGEIEKLPQKHSDLWAIFNPVKHSADEEAYERHLADEKLRQEFYELLSDYSKTLKIALSSDRFITETAEHKIKGYKQDLKRFHNLKAAVKKRYQETIDYRDYEPKIEKLLNTHVTANDVIQITPPVNIFDEEALEEALSTQRSPAAKADLIASATKRVITERMEQDPAFYMKFSKMIQDAIDAFRQQRLNEMEYLKRVKEIREAVISRKNDEMPSELEGNLDQQAVFGVLKPHFEKQLTDPQALLNACIVSAKTIWSIFKKREGYVGLWSNQDAQNAILNEIDDFFFDVARDELNIMLSQNEIDDLAEKLMNLARNRLVCL
jgi:type I restriction enzyme R subunit